MAWDRAERLALKQADAGVTITLERAYADLNQVLVGFTVAGLEAPDSSSGGSAALDWTVELRDPAGRRAEQWATGFTGMGKDETGLSAVVQAWEGAVAPAAGTWLLTFSSVGYGGDGFVPGQCDAGATAPECVDPAAGAIVEGTWTFEFELPTPTGTIVSADATDTVEHATLRLTELRVSPTTITARIVLAVDGRPVETWAGLPVEIRRDDTSYDVVSQAAIFAGDPREGTGESEFVTTAGSDEVAGTWAIKVSELTYQESDGEEITLIGPWTLAVTVP
jgi:hypothetical protein